MDTVVTRCRGRETDKKYVNGRDVQRRKHTAARRRRETGKVVCLLFFIYLWCDRVLHTSPVFFFLLKIGPKLFGPVLRVGADSLRAVTRANDRGQVRARSLEDTPARDRGDGLGFSARNRCLFFF
jgi:hypothetical protein